MKLVDGMKDEKLGSALLYCFTKGLSLIHISSPTLYDGEALKYIDYDLDLKVFPDNNYRVLDEEEYKQHAKPVSYTHLLA